MIYETVFDVRQESPDWGWLIVAPLMLVLGGLIAAGALPRFRTLRRRLLGLFFLCGGVLSFVLGGLSSFLGRKTIAADLQPGHSTTIEGQVTDFTLTQIRGRVWGGRFSVNGHRFVYSSSRATLGFHDAGQSLREGLPVRVTYAGDVILKLDVGR